MNDRDLDLLNGYADGELPAAAARDFERRLSNEPELAHELERIRSLKATLAALRPELEGEREAAGPAPTLARRCFAVAACLVLAVGLYAAYAVLPVRDAGETAVVAIHRAFSSETYDLDVDTTQNVAAAVRFNGMPVPDFTASNLTLVDAKTFEDADRIAVHYRGRRGCRVTLVVDTVLLELPPKDDPHRLTYAWSAAGLSYLLIAEGMDENRFAAIGAFAEAATRALERRDAFRTALVERTAAARPCA